MLDSDQSLAGRGRPPTLNQLQQITAARQGLARTPIAAAYGQFVAVDERFLHAELLRLYEQATVIEGLPIQPRDLMLESFSRIFELDEAIFRRQITRISGEQRGRFEQSFEADRKKKAEQLEEWRRDVKRRSDEYENRSSKEPPGRRAEIAAAFGLPREALTVLQKADPKDLAPVNIELMLHLLLLVGEAEVAHTILSGSAFNPITVLPDDLRPRFRVLSFRTAAALGDSTAAIDALGPEIQNPAALIAPPLAGTLQWLVFPDLGQSPLTRPITSPFWLGVFPKNQPAALGSLLQFQFAVQQYADTAVRIALLALEQGDIPLAIRRFQQALQVGGAFPFSLRSQAFRWLDLLAAGPR
jgi:hypothetical protein